MGVGCSHPDDRNRVVGQTSLLQQLWLAASTLATGGKISYDKQQTKLLLKESSARLKIISNKRNSLSQRSRRDIVKLLEKKQCNAAVIKVEHLIRDDDLIFVYDTLQQYLQSLLPRLQLLEQGGSNSVLPPPPPDEIKQAVATLIYASQYIDVDELRKLAAQFTARFGVIFAEECLQNQNSVDFKVAQKLSTLLPIETAVVHGYLQEIATTYNVDYTAPEVKPAVATSTSVHGAFPSNRVQPPLASSTLPTSVQPTAPSAFNPAFNHPSRPNISTTPSSMYPLLPNSGN